MAKYNKILELIYFMYYCLQIIIYVSTNECRISILNGYDSRTIWKKTPDKFGILVLDGKHYEYQNHPVFKNL